MPPAMVAKLYKKAQQNEQMRVNQPYQQYLEAGAKALPQLYAPAYRAISDQFRPVTESARVSLATNPAAANSGQGARLDRIIRQGAFGSLAGSMGRASAGVAQGGLDLLGELIQRRVEERYKQEEEKRKKKGGLGRALGSVVGSGLGMIGGPALGALGQKIGSGINPSAVY